MSFQKIKKKKNKSIPKITITKRKQKLKVIKIVIKYYKKCIRKKSASNKKLLLTWQKKHKKQKQRIERNGQKKKHIHKNFKQW